MSKKELPKNKKLYMVTLKNGLPRIIFKYNPNAIKHIRDKEGKVLKTVKNDGTGYAFTIKLINGEKILLDTEKQEFIINKLVTSGKIVEFEQWKTDQENKKILEDMEKDSGIVESETSNKE